MVQPQKLYQSDKTDSLVLLCLNMSFNNCNLLPEAGGHNNTSESKFFVLSLCCLNHNMSNVLVERIETLLLDSEQD